MQRAVDETAANETVEAGDDAALGGGKNAGDDAADDDKRCKQGKNALLNDFPTSRRLKVPVPWSILCLRAYQLHMPISRRPIRMPGPRAAEKKLSDRESSQRGENDHVDARRNDRAKRTGTRDQRGHKRTVIAGFLELRGTQRPDRRHCGGARNRRCPRRSYWPAHRPYRVRLSSRKAANG